MDGKITRAVSTCRGNELCVGSWAVVADALERITSLMSFNGCDQVAKIRTGCVKEMLLGKTELGVWAARFLEKSSATLTKLDLR